jgi:sugar phosphate permease
VPSRVRYSIAAFLLLGTAINYLDRVNISVAAPAIMAMTAFRKSDFGMVFSAFLLGYTIMQIPAGILSDKKHTVRLLAIAFCLMSVLTALTPLASRTLLSLLCVRFLLGMSESVIFPAVTALNARWFPANEFGRAQMFCASGAPIGQMIAYPLTAWLVTRASWQAAFYASAALGLLWAFAWYARATDYPPANAPAPDRERTARHDASAQLPSPAWRLRRLLAALPIQLLSASALGFSFVLWTVLSWLPTYMVEARGLKLSEVGGYGAAIQLCGAAGLISSGMVSDWLLRRTGRIEWARARLPGISLLVSAVLLVAAVTVSSTGWSIGIFGAFYFALMSAPIAYHGSPAALLPHQPGSVYGIINCCASFGGVLGPSVVGFITAAASQWQRSFEAVAGVGLIAAVLLLIVPIHRLDARQQ